MNNVDSPGAGKTAKAIKKPVKSQSPVLAEAAKKIQDILPKSINQNRQLKFGVMVIGGLLLTFGAFFGFELRALQTA